MTTHGIDIQDQLLQMTSKDPNGTQAEILLRRLTIFEGTFDSAAAAALAPTGMTDAETRAALTALQQWGLIGRVAVSEPLPLDDRVLDAIPRKGNAFATLQDWGFLDREAVPARYFVPKSIIRAVPPHEDAAERQYNYYRRIYGDLVTSSQADRYPMITLDWSNIHAALQWGLIHKPKTALELAWTLQTYIRECLPLDQQQALWQTLLSTAEQRHDLLQQGHALTALGYVAQHQNDLTTAYDFYRAAQTCYERDQSRASVSIDLKIIYDAIFLEELFETARDLVVHLYDIRRVPMARLSQATLLYRLHDVLIKQEQFDEALKMMLDLFRAYEQMNNERGQCDTLTNLGQTAVQSGDMDKARDYFAWALRMGERLLYHVGQMKTLWAWGQAEYKSGDQEAGGALCRQAIVAGTASPTMDVYARADALRLQLAVMEDHRTD